MEILRVQQVHSVSNLLEGFSRNFLRPNTSTSSKCCVSFRTVHLRFIPSLKPVQVICAASSEAPTPVKRGRGRPRKIKPQTQRETDNKDKASTKKRGRPKKNKQSLNDKQAENVNGVQPSTLNDKCGENAETSGDIISEKEEEEEDSEDEIYIDDDGEEFEEKAVKRDAEWVDDDGIDNRWKVRASDYFEEPLIKNVIGVDGTLIDWEGESYRSMIQEITCLEWENIAFHPSPLIVLVFERYIRASDNWKVLKELEKAIQVFWDSNKLPPRTVKVDAKIERDLASALRVKDTPQLLFLGGAKLLHRDTEVRTADDLVKMIAHFYYNAKKPPCLDNINST